MRPELLNPLFAETESLEGVGPKLNKPLGKLGLTRVKDVAYHLPDRFVERRAVADLDEAGVGEHVVVPLTVVEHRAAPSNRAPYRVLAQDAKGNVSNAEVAFSFDTHGPTVSFVECSAFDDRTRLGERTSRTHHLDIRLLVQQRDQGVSEAYVVLHHKNADHLPPSNSPPEHLQTR